MTSILRCSFVAAVLLATLPAAAQPYAHYQSASYSKDKPRPMVQRLGQRAFEPLVESMKGQHKVHGLIEIIAQTRHPKLKAFLLSKLADPGSLDPSAIRNIREEAIEALQIFADDPKVIRAIAALIADDKVARFQKEKAASFLVDNPHPAAADGLIAFDKVHGDSNTPLVNKVNRALGRTPGARVTAYLKQKIDKVSRAYMPWYGEIADGAALLKRRELVPELVKTAQYKNTVVPAVYRALGRIGDRRAVPALREAVVKRDFRRRYWSAVSLGELGDKSALPDLVQAFEKVKDYAASKLHVNRSAISYSRAKLGDPAGRKYLMALSKDPDPLKRMYGLMFMMKLEGKSPKAVAWAKKIVDVLRPYKDIGGCPSYAFEQILAIMAEIDRPEAGALIRELAGWQKAGRAPWFAKQVLARLPKADRVQDLLAQIRKGGWKARNLAANELDKMLADPFPHYERLLTTGDVDARMIAIRRLGLFAPKRFEKITARASQDPAWQVSDEVARLQAMARGQEPFPSKMPLIPLIPSPALIGYKLALQSAAPRGYGAQKHPLEGRAIRRLAEAPDGTIWAATQDGLQRYDGMQWKKFGLAEGVCDVQVFDLALSGKQVFAATATGLAVGDEKKFRCIKSSTPLWRVALLGKKVYLGDDQGVLERKGKRLQRLKGFAGRVGSLAVSRDGSLWVALSPPDREPKPEEAQPPLYRYFKGCFSPISEPFFHYNGGLDWQVGHERGVVSVNDLSVDEKGRLLLATTYGIFRREGERFSALSRGKAYWPWHTAQAVAASADGRILAGYPGYVDLLEQGRWKRFAFQELRVDVPSNTGAPVVALLGAKNKSLWISSRFPIQLPNNQYAATLVRMPVLDKQRMALPPETMVATVQGGAFRVQNPDTDMSLPNRLRKFDGGKTVRVPAQIVSITALSKDPWDYGPVQYRFKVDEGKWSAWGSNNGLISPQILDEGVHRIQAQSKDAHGNVDPSPAEVRFTVYTKEQTVIKIHDGQFPRIFPSQYMRYQKLGLGRVQLKNQRNKPVEVNLELKIEDLFEHPASATIKLAANETKWVDVSAPFSDKVLKNEGQRMVQAVVEARYSWDEAERSTRRSFPIELLEANAFVWDEPARLGAFINGRDPLVQKLASSLYRTFAERHPQQAKGSHPLRNYLLGLYAWQALSELGIKYKPDPNRPFESLAASALDTVQFPSQTLTRKTGDCDDLTVLYASVLENLNVPTAILPVQGHVFMMFDAGVRADNRGAFPVDARKTVEREGHLWVPVETTALGKAADFEAAWGRGAENYHAKYRPSPKQVVAVRDAWVDTPPATRPLDAAAGFKAPKLAGASKSTKSLMAGYAKRIEKMAGATGEGYEALIKRGRVLTKSGMFEQAVAVYEKAVKLKETFDGRYGLGAASAGRGEMLMALVEFQKSLGLAGGSKQKFRSQLAIAQCYKVNGNLNKAKKHLDAALKLNPAARFDKRTSALVKYLGQAGGTKAGAEDETPPFFQDMLSGL